MRAKRLQITLPVALALAPATAGCLDSQDTVEAPDVFPPDGTVVQTWTRANVVR